MKPRQHPQLAGFYFARWRGFGDGWIVCCVLWFVRFVVLPKVGSRIGSIKMYGFDDAITQLERKVRNLADVHGASERELRDDVDVLVALLDGTAEGRERAADIVRDMYAYCAKHDEMHGLCGEVN